MAYLVLIVVAAGLGVYGYSRGALRFGLVLLPLIVASLILRVFGPVFYRIDGLRNAGLIWPGLLLAVVGLAGGGVLQFYSRKKLAKEIHKIDRIGGSLLGVVVSLVGVWLGCVYTVAAAAREARPVPGSATRLAHGLNASLVRWIPGVGAGSDALMHFLTVATAEEDVRRRAIEDLGFDNLFDLPEMRAVLADADIRAEVNAAARGSIPAIWRLQRNALVLKLCESEVIATTLDRRSLADLAEAVRAAKNEMPQSTRSDW